MSDSLEPISDSIILNPKALMPRVKEFRDRFCSTVESMRRDYDNDNIGNLDDYIKLLEEMKADIDYLCII